jgi:hypothetical protein
MATLTPEQLDEERLLEQSILEDEARRSALSDLSPAGIDLMEQELVESLAQDGIQEPVSPVTVDEQFEHDDDIMSLATNQVYDEFDPMELESDTKNLKENPVIIPEHGSTEKQTYVDVLKDLKRIDKTAERLPVIGSLVKIEKMKQLMTAVDIINLPEGQQLRQFVPIAGFPLGGINQQMPVTQKDKDSALEFVEKWIIDMDNARNRTTGAKFTNALLDMPAFIVEFMLTGPLFRKGSVSAKKAATKFLGEYAENATGKLAVRATGAGFGSLVRTAVNVPKVIEGTLDRLTDGVQITDTGAAAFSDAEQNPWTAIGHSFLDLYIENVSEIAGGAIGEGFSFAGKGIAKKFPFIGKYTDEIAKLWVNNAPAGTERTLEQFLTKATTRVGFNGILGEFSEERLGDVMRAATGLQEWEDVLVSKEEALIEAGIFTVFGGVNLASEKIFRTDQPTAEPVRDIDVLRLEDGEPVTPESLSEDRVSLFESEKNSAKAAADNAKAMEFIDSQTTAEQKKPTKTPKGLIVPSEEDQKIVTVATKSRAIAGKAKESDITPLKNTFARAVVANIARAEDAAGTWGKTGKKVQKDLREISFRTAVNTGNTTQNIKKWTKGLSKTEKVTVAQLMDGAISREGQPNRLIQRADAIKKEMDKIQEEAQKLGLRKGELTGRAFPQQLNKEGKAFLDGEAVKGKASDKVYAWAQNQVKDGKFDNVDDAIVALELYRQNRASGREGYIEGQRTLQVDNEFRDWNLDKILAGTIESSWEKIEAARQWGVIKDVKTDAGTMMLPFKDVQKDMSLLVAEGLTSEADMLNAYLKAQYGISGAHVGLVKASRVVRATQFVGKLAFSPLTITRNMLDRYSKGLSHGTFLTNARAVVEYPPFLNHWMKSARNIEDQMIRNGSVLGHGHLSEGFQGTEGVISLIAKPFASSERGNQTYIALVKKLQLESDIKRLMEVDGPTGPTSKVLDRLAGIIGQSQKQTRNRVLTSLTNEQLAETYASGKIDDAVMAEVLHRTTTDSAFPLTLASKRLWWGNRPVIQMATQFKVWSADQTRFIVKDVINYGTKTGDWSRLGRFMVATWLMGEIYNVARDELTNKDESVLSKAKGGTRTEILASIANDYADGGGIGFIPDITYGIGNWLAGPSTATGAKIFEAVDNARGTATATEALGQFLLDDVPALRQAQGVIDNLDSIFDENSLTEGYSRWQGRSREFRKKKGDKIAGSLLSRTARGIGTKRVSEKTLSLDMIARQVLVGDYDDATKHIERVFEQTEVQDIEKTIQSLKQSMRNNSPFGNIAQKDMAEFAAQFTPEEFKEGLQMQQTWLEGYNIALSDAAKSLKKRDLDKEAKKYTDGIMPEIEKGIKVIEEALEILNDQ